jgi:hypothetical protein
LEGRGRDPQVRDDDGADTWVDIAVQSSSGLWSIGDETHVMGSKVFGQTPTINGRGDHPVTGLFRFHEFKEHGRNCGDEGPHERVHRHRRLVQYDHSFSLFGLSLGSRSVFSKSVQIELRNRTRRRIWVCGMSVSGEPVPPADAAMLYAGPRVRGGG